MADVFTRAKRSKVMSLIRGRDNKGTEIVLARLFRAAQIRGWRRQIRLKAITGKIAGGSIRHRSAGVWVRPDFTFRKQRLIVFVDGCFWHWCPVHGALPSSNRVFWLRKLTQNKNRDRFVTRALRRNGWRVLRIWEHELKVKKQAACIRRIKKLLSD